MRRKICSIETFDKCLVIVIVLGCLAGGVYSIYVVSNDENFQQIVGIILGSIVGVLLLGIIFLFTGKCVNCALCFLHCCGCYTTKKTYERVADAQFIATKSTVTIDDESDDDFSFGETKNDGSDATKVEVSETPIQDDIFAISDSNEVDSTNLSVQEEKAVPFI